MTLFMGLRAYLIDKFLGFFTPDCSDRADFLIVKQHPVEFVSCHQHLGPECCRDELRRLGKFMDHRYKPPVRSSSIITACPQRTVGELTRDSGSVLCVKIGIDLLVNDSVR